MVNFQSYLTSCQMNPDGISVFTPLYPMISPLHPIKSPVLKVNQWAKLGGAVPALVFVTCVFLTRRCETNDPLVRYQWEDHKSQVPGVMPQLDYNSTNIKQEFVLEWFPLSVSIYLYIYTVILYINNIPTIWGRTIRTIAKLIYN